MLKRHRKHGTSSADGVGVVPTAPTSMEPTLLVLVVVVAIALLLLRSINAHIYSLVGHA
jgi:hypothetical protein